MTRLAALITLSVISILSAAVSVAAQSQLPASRRSRREASACRCSACSTGDNVPTFRDGSKWPDGILDGKGRGREAGEKSVNARTLWDVGVTCCVRTPPRCRG
jgi:hypothetical protein